MPAMGKAKKTRSFATTKKMISPKDARLCVPHTRDADARFPVTAHAHRSKQNAGKSEAKKGKEVVKYVCVMVFVSGVRALQQCGWTADARALAHPPHTSPNVPTSMFFQYNEALAPPYQVLVDTNFINFSIKNKLDIVRAMMDCMLAKCSCPSCPPMST